MHPLLAQDRQQLPEILEQTRTLALEFLHSLPERSTCPALVDQQVNAEDQQLPAIGIGAQAALNHFWQQYQAGLSASAGPRYFGFVTGGSTPAALAADWLVSAFDQNCQLNHDTIAAALELATLQQMRQLVGLPESQHGSFVSGATMANFVGLAIGRQWLGQQRHIDVAQQGVAALGPIQVFAASAHSSSFKALSMLGIGREALQQVATLPDSEVMDVSDLAAKLAASPNLPTLVIASAGSVNTVAFDPLPELLALRGHYGFWLHVDAAFAGIAASSPHFAPLLAGWEQADSITIDCHKWLNVPYDSALQFSRHLDLQMQVFQNNASYLERPELRADNYLHMTPENSRRFRALPVWMALKAYGKAGIAEIVERNVSLAKALAAALNAHPGFTLLAPTQLNVVCFALRGVDGDVRIARDLFLQQLNQRGIVRCTPTIYQCQPAIRAALVNWMTEKKDIEQTIAALIDFHPANCNR